MKNKIQSVAAAMALLAGALNAVAQVTAFSYQGRLFDQAAPANGSYDLTFALFDARTAGGQVGLTLTNPAVAVSNGLFTVNLDYGGNVFTGAPRWLEIGVRTNGGTAFATLAPRQDLLPEPYSILAESALFADSAASVAPGSVTAAGIASNQVVKSINGLHDAVTLAAGNNVGLATNENTITISAAGGGGGGGGNAWLLAGNANTVPGANFVGTTDNTPLELWVNKRRALRLEPTGNTPNIIGGDPLNSVAGGITGATVAGGSGNTANAFFSGMGGGLNNTIGFGANEAAITCGELNLIDSAADHSFIGGGYKNHNSASYSVIAGGQNNAISPSFASTIAGGQSNQIASAYGAIGGGDFNAIGPGSLACVIGGGDSNVVRGTFSDHVTIAGGLANIVDAHGPFSTIGGGSGNEIQGVNLSLPDYQQGYSTIGGGQINSVYSNSPNSTIAGGELNQIGPLAAYATIAGGFRNQIQPVVSGDLYSSSTISGGKYNAILTNSFNSTIAGGAFNVITNQSPYSTVGGGYRNSVLAGGGTIAGGNMNDIEGSGSTIGGGGENIVLGSNGTIAGGAGNFMGTSSDGSTIAGGNKNQVNVATTAAIGGGYANVITNASFGGTIAGGQQNSVSASAGTVCGGFLNTAGGAGATVLGGSGNIAQGKYSAAAGISAAALHDNCFVWGDSSGAASTGANQFVIHAAGGVGINIASDPTYNLNVGGAIHSDTVKTTTGFIGPSILVNSVNSPSGSNLRLVADTVQVNGALTVSGNITASGQICGQTCQSSDRNLKENFLPVDRREILAKVASLPLTEWNYKQEPAGKRHLGPMAQDFSAAFGLNGEDDKHIAVVDESGVALAAIQGLNQALQEQRAELRAKDAELKSQQIQIQALLRRLTAVEQQIAESETK